MRLVLATVLFATTFAVAAEPMDPKKPADPKATKETPVEVRELDLKGLKLGPTQVKGMPGGKKFRTAEEFAKAIKDKKWLAKKENQVDFAKERVVAFEWLGAKTDTLKATVQTADKIVFTYKETKAEQPVSNFRLFVIPVTARFEMEKAK